MSKKVISLLLAVCMIFCLSACGGTETNNDSSNKSSESQKDKQSSTNKTSSVQSANSQVSSDDEDDDRGDSSQGESSEKQSKPTSTTTPNSHTHSYSNATCTSPKTCTLCEQTSGSALGHNYVNNKCSRCGKTDPDSLPKDLFNAHPPYETKGCSKNAVKINGESFANAFVMTGGYADGSGAHAYFNLGGKYSTLTFEVGHVDGSYMEDETLEIILDGVTLKTINLKANELKRQYTISVIGANQLVIKQSYTVAKYAIINSQLKK